MRCLVRLREAQSTAAHRVPSQYLETLHPAQPFSSLLRVPHEGLVRVAQDIKSSIVASPGLLLFLSSSSPSQLTPQPWKFYERPTMPGNSIRTSTIACCPGQAGTGFLFPGIVGLEDWSGLALSSQGTSFAVSDETVSVPPRLSFPPLLTFTKTPSNRLCKGFDSLLVKTSLDALSRSREKMHTHTSAMEADHGQRESLCLVCLVCILHSLISTAHRGGRDAVNVAQELLVGDMEAEGGWCRMIRADVPWNNASYFVCVIYF
jgi:hypothetical protein